MVRIGMGETMKILNMKEDHGKLKQITIKTRCLRNIGTVS